MSAFIKIPFDQMKKSFYQILIKNQFSINDAVTLSNIFAENSLEGVYTHGVNRFVRFIEYVQKGYIKTGIQPVLKNKLGGIEQWDGCLAPGPLNALFAAETSMKLASGNGIGCVSMANTNHWMRGGTYGKLAAEAGFIFIGWTNTISNMPAWGAVDARLGNNPFVLAVPNDDGAIVLDMALSQYSYGAMELAVMKNEPLAYPGGYTIAGELTNDPAAILQSRRLLPAGYWKGAGLALLLDILATVLSGGLSTHQISQREADYGASQVFIAIDITKLANHSTIQTAVKSILDDYSSSLPESASAKIIYPGQKAMAIRKQNLAEGIPVAEDIWNEIEAIRKA